MRLPNSELYLSFTICFLKTYKLYVIMQYVHGYAYHNTKNATISQLGFILHVFRQNISYNTYHDIFRFIIITPPKEDYVLEISS